MNHRPIAARITLAILFAAAVAAVPARGQEFLDEPSPSKYGFYFGIHMSHFAIGEGDFDGISIVIPAEVEAFIMPTISSCQSLGFSLGGGTARGADWGRFSLELRFAQAKPEATYLETVHPAVKAANWALSAKYVYGAGLIQPYLRGGLVYSRLRIADGAMTEDGEIGDAVFIGGGLEIALGLAVWIPPCFSIFVEASLDSMDYKNVKGVMGDSWSTLGQDGSGMVAGGFHYAAGIQFVF
jgi:hypothetical protein